MNHPNPQMHLYVSLFKSAVRIVGFVALLHTLYGGVILLIGAELIGVIEEMV